MSAAESIRSARELLDTGDTYQVPRAQVFALLAIAEALTDAGPADAIRAQPANYGTWHCRVCGHSWHAPEAGTRCPSCSSTGATVPWSELRGE